jgi:hypothetical protein
LSASIEYIYLLSQPSDYSLGQIMGKSRQKRKVLSKCEHVSEKKKLAEMEKLQLEIKCAALNSKITLMQHYQEPKGVNYR